MFPEKTPVVSIKDNEPVKLVDPEATSPSKNSAPENGGEVLSYPATCIFISLYQGCGH